MLVIGGGLGGCAAALAAAEGGARVALAESCGWIGGQLTAQATPPDEHGWIERFGCTRSYRRLRDGIRNYYREHYPLTTAARAAQYLNPGNGWVSPLCAEPRVALAVLEGMLAPWVSGGRMRRLDHHELDEVHLVGGDRIGAARLRDTTCGEAVTIAAKFVVDATELGDVIAKAGAESVTGQESWNDTGEPSAPAVRRPENAQAFSVCCVVDHEEGRDHTIPRPADYARWRDYVPPVSPPWPGRLLSWTAVHPRTMEPITYRFEPNRETSKAFSGLWSYRRIVDRSQFGAHTFASDLSVINWVMLDYCGGDLVTATPGERRRLEAEARTLTRSLVYWLQTEAPRPDGGAGWPGLRLRGEVTGSPDGLALQPYIRESRRLQAVFTIREQHVSAALRPGAVHAEAFPDSVGVGYYRIDLHPSCGGDNYIDVPALPFQIPLGALIPVRMENLLAAAKNIGTTHITNGCYRLHPVEWNIGEVAGALAAYCLERRQTPRAVHGTPRLLADFQQRLDGRGVERAWPERLELDEGDPHAHAR